MEKELFSMALGVEEPLYIESIIHDSEAGELHVEMNFRKGGKFACSECGAQSAHPGQ